MAKVERRHLEQILQVLIYEGVTAGIQGEDVHSLDMDMQRAADRIIRVMRRFGKELLIQSKGRPMYEERLIDLERAVKRLRKETYKNVA